jgi:hypothetical protein
LGYLREEGGRVRGENIIELFILLESSGLSKSPYLYSIHSRIPFSLLFLLLFLNNPFTKREGQKIRELTTTIRFHPPTRNPSPQYRTLSRGNSKSLDTKKKVSHFLLLE